MSELRVHWLSKGAVEYAHFGKFVVAKVYRSKQLPPGQPVEVCITGEIDLPGLKKRRLGFHMSYEVAKERIERRISEWIQGATGEVTPTTD